MLDLPNFYLVPWVGAGAAAAITAVRYFRDYFSNGYYISSAEFLGGLTGAAVVGFVVTALLCFVIGVVVFLLLGIWGMLRSVVGSFVWAIGLKK